MWTNNNFFSPLSFSSNYLSHQKSRIEMQNKKRGAIISLIKNQGLKCKTKNVEG
jgi:hypothetical protein